MLLHLVQRRNGLLLATIVTPVLTLLIGQERSHLQRYLIVFGSDGIWMLEGVIWIWLFLIARFATRGRLILAAAAILAVGSVGILEQISIAVAYERAAHHIRYLSEAVESYRITHPSEGYPEDLALISRNAAELTASGGYLIRYQVSRSNVGGPWEKFMIQAWPPRRDLGFERSYAAIDAAHIHFTKEARCADESDDLLN